MELEYRLDGPAQAPVLVLSNSLGTQWEMWDAQFSSFIKHFRVLRYNTRGHGNSPLPAQPMDLARLGQDVVDLLNHLHISCASFCGISLGGLTGLWLNLHYPQRFRRLVLANTAARIGTPDAWQARASLVRREGLAPVVAATGPRWFTADYLQQKPGIVENMLETLAGIAPAGYAACCDVLAQADLRAGVPEMTKPMLIIAGQQDPVTTVTEARWIVERAPAARLETLPASHMSSVAAATAFTHQTMTFLLRGDEHGTHD